MLYLIWWDKKREIIYFMWNILSTEKVDKLELVLLKAI